jgi:membrane protease YdiL (CAAX protease family)
MGQPQCDTVSCERSFGDWTRRVFAAYGASILGVLCAAAAIKLALNATVTGAPIPILSIIAEWAMRNEKSAQFFAQNPKLNLFVILAFAPVIEEGIRVTVLTFCKRFTRDEIRAVVIVLSGVMFGWVHGSPLNVPIQGLVGAMIGWMFVGMYLKRGYGQMSAYFACIGVHFMYNLTVTVFRL